MKLQSIRKSLRRKPVLIVAVLVVAVIGVTLATRYTSIKLQKKSSLSSDQIVQILKESELADPSDILVKDELLVSLKLGTLSPNLRDYVQKLGHYDRLYVSPTRLRSSKIYWEAQFLTSDAHRNSARNYILDALTGEIMLIRERGPIPGPMPLNISFEPSRLYLRRGENASVILTISGIPNYDVPWSPSVNMNKVESGLTVFDLNEINRLDTDIKIVFSFMVSLDAESKTVLSSIRFDCELVGTGTGFGYQVWTEPDS